MNIQFYIGENLNRSQPHFYLTHNDWDDYTRRTSFNLFYYNKNEGKFYVGKIKIAHEEETNTSNIIPSNFHELPDEFCSLGQDLDYYRRIKEFFPRNYLDILEALNDAALFPGIKERFENNHNFRRSLLRFSEAEKAYHEAYNVLNNIPFDQNFKFTYACQIQNVEGKHSVDFDFDSYNNLPNRIILLIGKNGTGKTQYLANLALDLSGKSKKLLKEGTFVPHRPLFSKVIAVSYSIFDKFSRPKADKSFSYKYCGLKDENGKLLTGNKIIRNYEEAATKIVTLSRQTIWFGVLKTIIGENLAEFFYEEIFEKSNFEIVNNNTNNLLSSGQSFLMYVITEIIANIKPNSLILFDEPEMHLHPNAISNLVRTIDRLLNAFDSYAIVATHSPIILQEIPSRYVTVFERQGNIPMIYKLGIESFGESIEYLTQEVFQTRDVDDNYKEVLKNLSEKHSYNEVLSFFDNKLSLHAKTFLLNQYENPKQELDG